MVSLALQMKQKKIRFMIFIYLPMLLDSYLFGFTDGIQYAESNFKIKLHKGMKICQPFSKHRYHLQGK